MKFFYKVLSIMLLTSACTFFQSCSKDDDPKPEPDPTPSITTPTLVGTWKIVDANGDTGLLNLNSDHTGSISMSVDVSNLSRATVTLTEYFNWNSTDDSSGDHWLEVIHTSGDEILNTNNLYILAGNTLQLMGFTWNRQ